MASELPHSSESSTLFTEFEGLEVTEFDEDTLRRLLEGEEVEPKENVQDNIIDGIMRSMDSGNGDLYSMAQEDSDSTEPHNDNFAWIDTMEFDPALQSKDMDFWCIDAHIEEIISGTAEVKDVLDNSYNSVQQDELPYLWLWQHN